jgi:uncharacterized protein (TIGR02246 family)
LKTIHALTLTLLLAACKSTSTTTVGGRVAEVRATVQRIIAADNARDLEAAVACYTEDAQWLPPDTEPIVGRAELRISYTSMFEAWAPSMTAASEETWILDDVAVDRGRTSGLLVSRSGGVTRKVDDKYMMVLRREDGVWRIARLMWNPNQPPD